MISFFYRFLLKESLSRDRWRDFSLKHEHTGKYTYKSEESIPVLNIRSLSCCPVYLDDIQIFIFTVNLLKN